MKTVTKRPPSPHNPLAKPSKQSVRIRRYHHSNYRPNAANKDESQSQSSVDDLSCFGVGTEVECLVNPQSQDDSNPTQDQLPISSSYSSLETTTQPSSTLLDTLLVVSPFFFWGTSMVAMKQLGPHTTPLFLASWRLIPAGILLLAWAQVSNNNNKSSSSSSPSSPSTSSPTTSLFPRGAIGWLAVALFGLVDGACFQGFLAEGLQRTAAGLGSVIIDSQPLTVALLASLLFGERLGPVGWAGLAAGITGLSLLEIPPESISLLFGGEDLAAAIGGRGGGIVTDGIMMGDLSSITSSLPPSSASSWSIWDSGEWWMLLAAQSMAVGTVMVRWVAKYSDPVVATGWHMILGGIPLALLTYTQDGAILGDRLSQLTGTDVLLLLYVSVLGSAASYGVFFYEATVRGNLTALSSLTFLTPMFAAGGGYLFLGEVLTPVQLIGAAVTLGAVTMISKDDGGDMGSK